MNTIAMYQVDAFTDEVFKGNPAAVCPLESWLDDEILLNIARENNLAETAFFVRDGQEFHLRWFTPEIEMDLCGHATLASAHVIFNHMDYANDIITFNSASGKLVVSRNAALLTLNFPSRPPQPIDLPKIVEDGIGRKPVETLKARDYVLVYESERHVLEIAPDQSLLNTINLDPGGIIVTAQGEEVDFVSRFFTPGASVFEDPVTGSAHCSLIPFWSARLGKTKLKARQVSDRVGELDCQHLGERVLISGKAVTFLEGKIRV